MSKFVTLSCIIKGAGILKLIAPRLMHWLVAFCAINSRWCPNQICMGPFSTNGYNIDSIATSLRYVCEYIYIIYIVHVHVAVQSK